MITVLSGFIQHEFGREQVHAAIHAYYRSLRLDYSGSVADLRIYMANLLRPRFDSARYNGKFRQPLNFRGDLSMISLEDLLGNDISARAFFPRPFLVKKHRSRVSHFCQKGERRTRFSEGRRTRTMDVSITEHSVCTFKYVATYLTRGAYNLMQRDCILPMELPMLRTRRGRNMRVRAREGRNQSGDSSRSRRAIDTIYLTQQTLDKPAFQG